MFPKIYQLRHHSLISFMQNNSQEEEQKAMERISQQRDPFDEIDSETLEIIKFDPKNELPLYSKFSLQETQNSTNENV
jgi:hypothetical protein